MSIATGTGDDGSTGLLGGLRVGKDDGLIEVLGRLDEVNALLGLALTHPLPADIADLLTAIQHRLFDLGAILADPSRPASRFADLRGAEIGELDAAIDHLESVLPPLRVFILPGGAPAAATVQVARTAVRAAERALVALTRGSGTVSPCRPPAQRSQASETSAAEVPSAPCGLVWLNRLSDLLFLVARRINDHAGVTEPAWSAGSTWPAFPIAERNSS